MKILEKVNMDILYGQKYWGYLGDKKLNYKNVKSKR